MSRFLPVLLSTALLVTAARAADAPATIRLLAFSRVGEEMAVAVTDAAGNPLAKEPVALPTQQFSPPQVMTARSLVFRSPKDPKTILGKVRLPATGSEFILVFLPAPATAAEVYHVDPVPMPAAGFGSGDYAFLNYSGSAVGCVIDGEKLLVPHGKATVYQAAKSGKGAGNRTIVCYQEKAGKWAATPFFSSRLIIQDGVRNLVLICLDPRTSEIDFRGIPDFVTGK